MNYLKNCIFLATVILFQGCLSNLPSSPEEIKVGSVTVKIPSSKVVKLPNGLTVIFQDRKELPMVKGSLFIPRGSAHGSCGIPGLSALTVSQMREGGSKSLTPNEVDAFLDDNAVSIEFSQSEDFSSFTFNSLSQDFSKTFKIFSDLVFEPRFDKGRLALSKELAKEGIIRRKDDPETMAIYAFSSIVYGANSPWYEPTDIKSLSKISRDDIVSYHKSFLVPEGSYLVISGNINEERLFKEIEEKFTSWKSEKSACDLKVDVKEVPDIKGRAGIYYLNRDFAQSTLVMGNPAPTLKNLDVYNLNIFNRVFGSGSFDSILFKEIRDKRGLAYGVTGGISATAHRGLFSVNLATRSNAVSEAITGLKTVVEDLRGNGFLKSDIDGAINASKQSFVFKFSNPDFAVSRPAILDLSGYPEDYDRNFLEKVSNINHSEIKNFLAKVNPIEEMVIVVVGKVDVEDLKKKMGNKFKYCELAFDELPSVKVCQ